MLSVSKLSVFLLTVVVPNERNTLIKTMFPLLKMDGDGGNESSGAGPIKLLFLIFKTYDWAQ
jgi:hypothetical protein